MTKWSITEDMAAFKTNASNLWHQITSEQCGYHCYFENYAIYRAMHFSAKRGIAIACRLSVCDVGELWSHRLEFFKNNFTIS